MSIVSLVLFDAERSRAMGDERIASCIAYAHQHPHNHYLCPHHNDSNKDSTLRSFFDYHDYKHFHQKPVLEPGLDPGTASLLSLPVAAGAGAVARGSEVPSGAGAARPKILLTKMVCWLDLVGRAT